MDAVLSKQLQELIENALIAAAPDTPIKSLAKRLIDSNRELIDLLMEEWRVSYVARLVRAKQAQIAREQRTAQLMLPGFERLPGRITVSEGRRKPLEQATARQLREYLIVLRRRQKNNTQISQVLSLLQLLKKWQKKLKSKGYGLTVAEVMQREAGLQ